MRDPETYRRFAEGVRESKRALLELLIGLRREGKQVVGYGAPGKGNTLLNYCGIRTDFLDYTVDRNPYKQGKHTPGTHIPIHPPERIAETRPDVIVILPWNLAREISEQLAYTAEWGARLVVPIPTATIFEPGSLPPEREPCREGRRLLRRARRAHGRGDAADPEADDPDRQPADPLGDHALLRGVGAHRVRALPRLQGRRRSASTSSTTTRRCSTTSCSRGTVPTPVSSCSSATSAGWRITFVDTGMQSTIGERLKAVEQYLNDDEEFLATYGDGLTDAPLDADGRRVPQHRGS